ncbi:MAG TPA: M28 family peptidase [Pyrinomonadaceae bacterium]|nr:M28 family peptidase [Pyrinomonadaceae bacterium]
MLWILAGMVLLLVAVWFWLTQPLLSRAQPNPVRTVDPARLEAHVRKLAVDLSPRDITHPENLDRAAAYISGELTQAGGSVSEQAYRVENQSYRNVIARFGPDTPERIVIGAHYDACGPLPGADDNASGVAGLIELGRLLGARRASVAAPSVVPGVDFSDQRNYWRHGYSALMITDTELSR